MFSAARSTFVSSRRYTVKLALSTGLAVAVVGYSRSSQTQADGQTHDRPHPPFALGKTYYPQDSFRGRFRTILNQIDPRTLFISDAELADAQLLLQRFKEKELKPGEVSDEELWKAKHIVDAVVHAPTGEKMFAPGRMSAFVLMNTPTLIGMLVHGPTSIAAGMFWQFVNQSYNVVNNYVNRAGREVDNISLLKSYMLGVTMACGLSFAAGQLVARKPALRRFGILVPYIAVGAAGSCNIAFTRMDEVFSGVNVAREDGKVIGTSILAGKLAVGQTILTRGLCLPIVPMLLPPLVMKALAMTPGGAALAVEVAVITTCMGLALPAALALMPQKMELSVQHLEVEFQTLSDANGKPVLHLYADKGL